LASFFGKHFRKFLRRTTKCQLGGKRKRRKSEPSSDQIIK
jgi:hypothetical protein